jgi:hypothetical protein
VSMVAYLLILLLLPKEAPLGQTTPDQIGFIGENQKTIKSDESPAFLYRLF